MVPKWQLAEREPIDALNKRAIDPQKSGYVRGEQSREALN